MAACSSLQLHESRLLPTLHQVCPECALCHAQARQRAELSATDAEDKLKAYMWSVEPRSGEGAQTEGAHAKAMADLDASLMQRLDEDRATNHKLLQSLQAAQVIAAIIISTPALLAGPAPCQVYHSILMYIHEHHQSLTAHTALE